MSKPWEESETAFAAFIAGFEGGTYPKQQWTHEAHVAMAAHYLTLHPVDQASRIIRAAIPAYNVAQGGKNTDDSGYHETLTVFWIWVVAGFLASLPPDLSRIEMIRAAAARYGTLSSFHKNFYGHNVIGDVTARHEWVPPQVWR